MTFSRKLYGLFFVCALAVVLAACSSSDPKFVLASLPDGNAAHGAQIFQNGTNGSVPCVTCHRTDDLTQVGPGLKGVGQRAEGRVPDEPAKEYLFNSILRPAAFLVPGFSNLMPPNFGDKLSPQDVADLIAYLMML